MNTSSIRKTRLLLTISGFVFASALTPGNAQDLPGRDLEFGSHSVGFKIITRTDKTRTVKPMFDYLGKPDTANIYRDICIHLWYPAARNTGEGVATFEDYATNRHQSSTLSIDPEQRRMELNGTKTFFTNQFGAFDDERWSTLRTTAFLGLKEADHTIGEFPLLIGMLRPLSTATVCEYLASHGYVVAMIKSMYGSFSENEYASTSIEEVRDMQFAITAVEQMGISDSASIGTFGFSGSGFTQVLLAMHDFRIRALADIESALYAENLWQRLSSVNLYKKERLRVPFLHIYNRELAQRDKHFDEFHKLKFSRRYHLMLNLQGWHHWNVATEGYLSAALLDNRGENQVKILESFEISALYLLNFFNAELKSDRQASRFLSEKPRVPGIEPLTWDIEKYDAVKPAPSINDFEKIVQEHGIVRATTIVRSTIVHDSSSTVLDGRLMNALGYRFLQQKKYEEAIGTFLLNTAFHPGAPNWFDSLAEAYELSGNTKEMKNVSIQILDMLKEKDELTDHEKILKELAEKRVNL